jgi:hypothetical protein
MKQRPPSCLDPWLAAFLLLMVAASVIAAHGAFVFFGYLVEPWVAVLATTVTAVGIPALDAAGTLEKTWKRWLYWAGGLLLLGMETLANYFAGQAVFATRVAERFAGQVGVDLAYLAEKPIGRVLVVVYLALPSLIVAYFAFAAASRWRVIRDARAKVAQGSQRSRELRATVRGLIADVRGLRSEIAKGGEVYHELKHKAREDYLVSTREAQELREQLEQATQGRTELEQAVRGAQQQARDVSQTLREREEEIKELREQVREPLALFASEPPTRARVIAYVREQMAAGRSRLEVARELGFADGTLRSWMEAEQSSNGVESLN